MASEQYLIDGLAYRTFGGYARRNRHVYFDLEVSLKKGNINVPLDIYVARMMFISATAGFAVAMSFVMVALMAALTSPYHTFLPWHDVSSDNLLITVAASQPFALVLLAGASFIAAFVTSYLLYRNYPFYRASIRESNINQMLPHAVTFMYAMSNGGMNLLEIFRTMNEHSDIYGEVAVELETVVRGVDLLGLDLITSIKQASLLTASEPLRNFFDSLAANMESGGDLAKFMHSRSDQFQVVASQERRALLDMLNMLAEVYVTAFVAGPLFLITILDLDGHDQLGRHPANRGAHIPAHTGRLPALYLAAVHPGPEQRRQPHEGNPPGARRVCRRAQGGDGWRQQEQDPAVGRVPVQREPVPGEPGVGLHGAAVYGTVHYRPHCGHCLYICSRARPSGCPTTRCWTR